MGDEEGFNALTDKYENLVAAGVIDPTKVVPHRAAERRVHRFADADHRSARVGDSLRRRRERPGGLRKWAGCTDQTRVRSLS